MRTVCAASLAKSAGEHVGRPSQRRFRRRILTPMVEPVEDADIGRRRVLDRLIRALLLFGGFALVPSVIASFAAGLVWLAVVDVAMYGWIVVLEVLRSRLSYATRVTHVLVAVSVLSVVLLLALGLHGAGLLWLVAGPILAALLLDRRSAWLAVAGFGAVLLGLGVWITVSTAPFEVTRGELMPLQWWVMAGNALALVVAGTVMIQAVLGALEAAHERLTTERELRLRLEGDLRNADQAAAVGALAGGVAHELNNLLQAILLPVVLVHDQLRDPELREDLAHAVTAATGARDVTSRLLALARRHGSVDRDVIELDGRVQEIMALVRAAIPPPTVITYTPRAPGISICAARGELEVVLVNLCLNAAQADPQASITITTRNVPHGVVIVVEDNGPGIPEEIQAHVFEPFFTTRDEGTGIGLASVHRVIESLGGSIVLRSRAGEGTTFEVFLPATERAVSAKKAADIPAKPRPGGRLLLVDDDTRVRIAHRSALSRAGYDVIACESGEDGLEQLDPAVDVLVTDLRMPGMGGAELARRALGRFPSLRVVVCSGLVDATLERDLRGVGVSEVLHKPVTLAELLYAVAGARGSEASGDAPVRSEASS